eukprot:TRINITY_DN71059_c0_g1_i1.p1 TRINITY_DN71059_c0_g1~~TRINITY_DN71059_c0_g1_i1.p1  ORF type:complete len:627 (+),score=196.80 TRINITY_DN71059_c0_g1_i1:70-1881(+)
MPPRESADAKARYDEAYAAAMEREHYQPLLRHEHQSIVNREELVRNVMKLCEDSKEPLQGIAWCQSGGTFSKVKYYTPSCHKELAEQHQSTVELCGKLDIIKPHMVVLNLLQGAAPYLVYKEWDALLGHYGCTVLPCDGTSPDDYLQRTAQRFRANTVAATPARLVQFAWYLGSQGINIPIPNIILYGDVVRDCHLDAFNTVFGEESHGKLLLPRVATVYGTAELGIIGFSPHQLRDPRSVIYDDRVIRVDIAECTPEEIPPSIDERWAECYENQRRFPMVGWKTKLMPGDCPQWTAADGKTEMRRDMVPLPSGEWGQWAFQGEWAPAAEWQYAWEWTGPWYSEEAIAQIPDPSGKKDKPVRRRRQWRIKMVKTGESKGTGRVLLSVLCRRRWPMLRYDTGDMGTQRDPVMYAGDRYPCFRLSGNPAGAFGLHGGVPIWASEFAPPLREFYEYQLTVEVRQDEAGAQDVVTLLVVPPPVRGAKRPRELSADDAKRLVASIREVLETLRDDPLPDFLLEIRTVAPTELNCAEASLRLRRLLDNRGAAAPVVRKRARSRIVRRRGLSLANPAPAKGEDEDGGGHPGSPAPGDSPKAVRFADPDAA